MCQLKATLRARKQPDGLTQPLNAGLDGDLIDAGEIQAKGRGTSTIPSKHMVFISFSLPIMPFS
jgi:hypothetical protein